MPGTFGLTLAAFFFVLIPGVVGVKFFLQNYVRLDDLTRIDKLVFSAIAGSAILLLVLLVFDASCTLYAVVEEGAFSLVNGGTCGGLTRMSFGDFSNIPASRLLLFASGETVIAGATGALLGDYYNRQGDGATREDKYIEQPWEFASKKIVREDTKATVITTDGDRIRGTVHRLGAPSENSNLLLKDPTRTVYDRDENQVRMEGNIAPFSYHHHLDISQVYFDDLSEESDLEGDEGELEDTEQTDYTIRPVLTTSGADEGESEISFKFIGEDTEQTELTGEAWSREENGENDENQPV